jgi:hypothetical protein
MRSRNSVNYRTGVLSFHRHSPFTRDSPLLATTAAYSVPPTLSPTLLFPGGPPCCFPVMHYRRAFMVNGVPVIAAVTSLTAAFLQQIFGAPQSDDVSL